MLRASHSVSDTAHWVIPKLLMQGDGSKQDEGVRDFEVSSDIREDGSISLQALDTLAMSLNEQLRSDDDCAVYVHGSAADEAQVAILCACTLAELYQISAAEAFARVRGYCEVRGDGATERIFQGGSDASALDTVQRFIRKARASDCAEN